MICTRAARRDDRLERTARIADGRRAPRRGRHASLGALAVVVALLSGCSAIALPQAADARPTHDRVTGEPAAAPAATASPTAVGSAFAAGRFSYRIGAIAWDQGARLAAANATLPAPVPGYGWALLPLTVRNSSTDPATPGQFTVTLHAGGWAISHRQAAGGLVRLPGEFRGHLLQPGDEVTGNLGFWIPDRAKADPECWIEVTAWSAGGRGVEAHRFRCD